MNDIFMFLQVGEHIISKRDIVYVKYGKCSHYCDTPDAPQITITLRSIYGDGEASYSDTIDFVIDSPEGQAFLSWLSDNTQVLLPLEQKTSDLLSGMEERIEAQQAQFEDDRSPYPQPDDEY